LLTWVGVKTLSRAAARTVRLYAVVVMVVLVASAVAELLVLARLADLTVLSDRNRWSIGDDASSILAASQFARGGYEPEKLEIHCPEEVAYPPTGVQPSTVSSGCWFRLPEGLMAG
jgi:hypothetical protein